MWKPTNLMETLLPLFILDCVFCHGVMPYKSVKKLKINHSLLYSVVSLILYLILLIFIILKFPTQHESKMLDGAIKIMRGIYTIIMITNIIISWIFRNKATKLVTHILKADETLKNLGIAMNIQREFCFALKVTVLWIFYSVLTCPIVTLYDFKNLEKITKLIAIVVAYHAFFVNLLVILKFILLIKHMRLRLKNINKVLKNFLRSHTKNMTQEGINNRWATSVRKNLELDFIHNLRRIHLKLGTLCRKTTTVYGTPLAFTTIGLFANIIGSLYCQSIRVLSPDLEISFKIRSIVITLICMVPCSLMFVSVNYICKDTINEWRKTGVILDKLELKYKETEIQTEIRNFSAQVQRNTLKFSPGGFFDLDFYFVRDFAAAVATYLVIMLQTYPSKN